jgi:hypothetical protein
MPRFAILAHDHPSPHWDLFLEAGPVLRSWRLPVPLCPGSAVPAEPAADHRLPYLDYEGPVSGNRGSVRRIDAGTFEWETDAADQISVQLAGLKFTGRLRIEISAAGWECRFEPG